MTEIENSDQTTRDNSDVYVQIGEALKTARLSRKLDLADVSQALRLSGMTIEDMENGRLDRLAGLYRRGYVANYARLVGLDPAPLLAMLDPEPAPELRQVLPRARTGWKVDKYIKFATYAVVTIAIVPPLIVFFVQGGLRLTGPEPTPSVAQVESAPASGEEQRMARRIARALAVEDRPDTEIVGPVAASALPIRTLRPVRELQADDSVLDSDASQPDSALAIDELLPLRLELGIELLEDSWVEIYSADGRRLEYDLLRSGLQRSYQGEPPLRLLLGRASAVRLFADGQAVEYPGDDRADVVSLELLPGGEVRR